MVLALGLGWGLSAIDVRYRDVRYALPFMTQLWFFASPIAYPISLVSESWRWVFGLNPLCGLIEAMRWSLLGAAPHLGVMAVSMLVIAVLFVAGLYLFRTCERDLVDRL